MSERCRLPVLVCLVCLAVGGARGASPERAADSESYTVLIERNIFLRDRARGRSRESAPPPAPVYSDAHYIVLRGIVRQGEEYVVFLEDTRSRVTSRVAAGGVMPQGVTVRPALDALAYEKDGRTITVELGRNLEGDAPATESVPRLTGGNGAPAAMPTSGGPASANGGAESSILERLRQRRQQELEAK